MMKWIFMVIDIIGAPILITLLILMFLDMLKSRPTKQKQDDFADTIKREDENSKLDFEREGPPRFP